MADRRPGIEIRTRRGAKVVASRRAKRLTDRGERNPLVYLVAVATAALTAAPVIYVMLGGFRSNQQINTDPTGLPNPWKPSNYLKVFADPVFWNESKNSLVIAVGATVGVCLLGVMVAFVLARYSFKGRGALYAVFAAGLMFPLTVAALPLYLLLGQIGLAGNPLSIILPQIGFQLPMTVVILVPFLRAIPAELEEASIIDGTTRIGFFWRILLPLSVPGLVTVGVLGFIASWNAYLLPMLLLNRTAEYTLPLGVAHYATEHSTDTAMVLAFTSICMLPALIFFTILQKRIVGGLTGAVKG
ncbi:MAG: carbohydrate ABC transporter permease [Bifidobacteriaceae bacterium]|jgi:raffinose/stachyose/melibiose transport system permease protein|nr:carbohydrate ABC transporter permease [Bifidobacteriaceae bacterium]